MLHPRSLVVGVGTATGVAPQQLRAVVVAALHSAGLSESSVAEVATIDTKGDEPAILALGWPVLLYSADCLAAVPVPNPSSAVASAVGTASVAEAAALHGAGPGAVLVVPKQVGGNCTVAIARRP